MREKKIDLIYIIIKIYLKKKYYIILENGIKYGNRLFFKEKASTKRI